jgi:hypothetical protein
MSQVADITIISDLARVLLTLLATMLTGCDQMTYENSQELYVNRNKSVAKSFYRQLKNEGFTHQQIIELSTTLLDLVTEDLRDTVHSPAN